MRGKTGKMTTIADDVQQLNASIWSITSQIVDDCEQILSQMRSIRAEYQAASVYEETTAVSPLESAQKQSQNLYRTLKKGDDPQSSIPELYKKRSLLAKYTTGDESRIKRVCMEHKQSASIGGSKPHTTSTPRSKALNLGYSGFAANNDVDACIGGPNSGRCSGRYGGRSGDRNGREPVSDPFMSPVRNYRTDQDLPGIISSETD